MWSMILSAPVALDRQEGNHRVTDGESVHALADRPRDVVPRHVRQRDRDRQEAGPHAVVGSAVHRRSNAQPHLPRTRSRLFDLEVLKTSGPPISWNWIAFTVIPFVLCFEIHSTGPAQH